METVTFIIFNVAIFVLSFCLTTYWTNKNIRGIKLLVRSIILVIGISAIWFTIR